MIQDSPREVGKLLLSVLTPVGRLNASVYASTRTARIFTEEFQLSEK